MKTLLSESFLNCVAEQRALLQARVDSVVARRRLGPNVAVLEWVDPLFVGGHWTPELIEMAGG